LPPGEGKLHAVGLRTTRKIYDALREAAAQSGRSIAQEVERRVEQSLENVDFLTQAQKLAFGPLVAVALAVIGRATVEINGHAKFPQNWSEEPRLIDEVIWTAEAVFGGIAGRLVAQPAHIVIAPMIVWSLLAAVKNPETGASALREWAKPLREILGDEFTERLRVGADVWIFPNEQGTGIGYGPGDRAGPPSGTSQDGDQPGPAAAEKPERDET